MGGGGSAGKYNCYHVAIFLNCLSFDMQHDHVLKKLNFDLLTPTRGSRCGGLQAEIPFHLICNMNFNHLTPRVGGGLCGEIFGTILLHFMIQFNLISNMTML